jgi:PIN domain nuclease of toxin-antitoxin system
MNYLLDTHTLIWWATDPERIPKRTIAILRHPQNELYFSAASSWEVQIKIGIGKISFSQPWETIVEREIEKNSLIILPVTLEHTFMLAKLPSLHKDPFDRMLIAQALSNNITIITNDRFICSYPEVKTVW